jgi:hypothetical protein
MILSLLCGLVGIKYPADFVFPPLCDKGGILENP